MNETTSNRLQSGWIVATGGAAAGVHLFGVALCLSALVNYVPRPDIATAVFAVAYLLLVAYRIRQDGLALRPTRVNLAMVALLIWFALSGAVAYFHKTDIADYARGLFPFLFLASYFLFDLRGERDRQILVRYLIAASLLWGAAIIYAVGIKVLAGPETLIELAQARLVQTEPNTVLPFGIVVLPFIMLSRPRIVGLLWIVLLTSMLIWSGYRLWLGIIALEILTCLIIALISNRAMLVNVVAAAAAIPLALTVTFAMPVQLLLDHGAKAWLILAILIVGFGIDQMVRRRIPFGMVASLLLAAVIFLYPSTAIPDATDTPEYASDAPMATDPQPDVVEEAPWEAMMRRLSIESLLTDSRIDEIDFAWQRFLESPLFGKGLGFQLPASVTFPEDVMGQVSIEVIPESAGYMHNVVAYLLMTTGIVGLLLYLLPILLVLVPALNRRDHIGRAALFALAALLIFANFSAVFRLVQFSLLLVAVLKLLDGVAEPKRVS